MIDREFVRVAFLFAVELRSGIAGSEFSLIAEITTCATGRGIPLDRLLRPPTQATNNTTHIPVELVLRTGRCMPFASSCNACCTGFRLLCININMNACATS